MERLTYDFALGGNHCWHVKGADNLECREVCERQGDDGCKTCPIAKAFDRLAAIEDILGDEYDLDELKEVAQAKREGRCVVVPSDYDGEMFKIWMGQILSSRRFETNIKELGKTVFLTREEAQAALRREQG